MKTGFIGAGNVGTAFGVYLKNKGFPLSGYFSRNPNSALKAANLTQSEHYLSLEQLVQASGFTLITTNDDQIETIATRISEIFENLQGKHFAHMSGALSSECLLSLKSKGAFVSSLHPIQSFASVRKAIKDLDNTWFGIEGGEGLQTVIDLLTKTGNPFLQIAPEDKTRYHIASCVVSNYLVTLLDYGLQMLDAVGIDKKTGLTALKPMISGSIENLRQYGAEEALTGPIARGDVSTIHKHLQSFSAEASDEAAIYRFLGNMTLELAQKKKLKEQSVIKQLSDLLSVNPSVKDPNSKES